MALDVGWLAGVDGKTLLMVSQTHNIVQWQTEFKTSSQESLSHTSSDGKLESNTLSQGSLSWTTGFNALSQSLTPRHKNLLLTQPRSPPHHLS